MYAAHLIHISPTVGPEILIEESGCRLNLRLNAAGEMKCVGWPRMGLIGYLKQSALPQLDEILHPLSRYKRMVMQQDRY